MSSYAQMVADDEIAASVRRLLRGFGADALAVGVIAEVMNGPRNFLGERHTVRYLRAGEVLHTRLAERGSWKEMECADRYGMAERAQVEAERLLTEHHVPPLTEEQELELDAIMQEAESELVK